MPAIRPQVYLTPEQRLQIDWIAGAEGVVTMADVIRRAVDRYLASAAPSPAASLTATFGAIPDLTLPDRDEWDRG
jgi:hypothetical protein